MDRDAKMAELERKQLPSGKYINEETVPYGYSTVTERDWTNGNCSIQTSRVMAEARSTIIKTIPIFIMKEKGNPNPIPANPTSRLVKCNPQSDHHKPISGTITQEENKSITP